MKQENNNKHNKINIIVFVATIFIGGILFYILPKKAIAEDEKRVLSPFPEFTVSSFFEGKYTDSIDKYYADNFVFRDGFLNFASFMKDNVPEIPSSLDT